MEKYAKLTEKILNLSKEDLCSNTSKIDKCLLLLEERIESFNKPKAKWFWQCESNANWFEGVGVANCGAVLTNHLDSNNLIIYQERAAKIWASATLKFCGHYRHMVGPAMVANAKIAEKKNDQDRLLKICNAISCDFVESLDRCEEYDYRPEEEDEDFESIKSLEFALDKLIELGSQDEKKVKLKERVTRLWQKPANVN